MIPSWSQGSQNDPCMLSQGPDILLQGYDIIHPSCGIQPRMLARAPLDPQGLRSPCPYHPFPIYIHPCRHFQHAGVTGSWAELGGASWRPVKMRSKSISPSPLCGRLADSQIDPRKIHALGARGFPWAPLGTPWAQHVIPYDPL